ncbi:hypothetical protein HY488_00690 [Candidatus Woesearchaeota archaeon]|nr:hypothetical protein [Candidatus Woesearchaeota archaeon]
MAFLEDIFGKKPATQKPFQPPMETKPMPNDIPVEQVIAMRSQGLSNNQIIQNLQRAGYSVDQINNAINQADIKEGIVSTPFSMGAGAPPAFHTTQGMGSTGAMGGMNEGKMTDERIQEIAEAIIDEKWTDLINNVNKILDWKDTTESRVARIEQAIQDMKSSFDRLHEGVLGKISEYDHGLQDIGTEIKALEKVFQKILPGFIENVNELSRITQQIKKTPSPMNKKPM